MLIVRCSGMTYGGHDAIMLMMPFHRDHFLREAFQGHQGPPATTSRIIFVGKDANFPDWGGAQPTDRQQLQRDSVLAFLKNGAWRENADFRESQCYLSRNLHPARAHHPSLLRCFHGNKDGAKYHRTFACLIDRIIDQLQAADRDDIVADLVTKRCTFVELIRFPTTGNNGNVVQQLFQADLQGMPSEWGDAADFCEAQANHRNKTLPSWLLNSERQKSLCTVVLPKSVFALLCEAQWHGLKGGHLNDATEYFKAPNRYLYPLAHLGDCDWLVTDGFPYFSHFAGWGADTITEAMDQLAKKLAVVLRQ